MEFHSGRPGFYDLDSSWLEYLKEDRKGRQKMCEDALMADALALGIAVWGFIILAVLTLIFG